MKTKKAKPRFTFSNFVAIALIVCLAAVGISGALAKYTKSVDKNDYAAAEVFYFSSDVLDGKIHDVTALDNGTASITLTLMNHDDELRASEVDVNYNVTIKDLSTGSLIALNSSNSVNASGTIPKGSVADKEVTLSQLQPGKSYLVTASTTGNYRKSVYGTIRVTATDKEIHTALRDQNEYIELTLWTVDYGGDVKINYPSSLLPDNTDDLLKNAKATSSNATITVPSSSFGAHKSYIFRFFKVDSNQGYSVSVNGKRVTLNEN
ncbi:MAG: hypothetical protein Q4C99_01725 [Clostridia bacterium]|nr:hypothetical protein [Clostridia bacterium]